MSDSRQAAALESRFVVMIKFENEESTPNGVPNVIVVVAVLIVVVFVFVVIIVNFVVAVIVVVIVVVVVVVVVLVVVLFAIVVLLVVVVVVVLVVILVMMLVVIVGVVVVACYHFSSPTSMTSSQGRVDRSDLQKRRVLKEAVNRSYDSTTGAWFAAGADSHRSLHDACSSASMR